MTKQEIEARQAVIQGGLDKLGMELIQANSAGIQLLTEQALLTKRLEDNDYQDEN
tara:strand:+ start:610 stop:774 length:165 start_codon:yes stop_codon:yes gene_type:complete